jgi:hypothetical protein
MGEQSPSAQDEPAPKGSTRLWDEETGTWIEAAVRRRDTLGRVLNMYGVEQGAQQVLD